jgi:hypothetical protein
MEPTGPAFHTLKLRLWLLPVGQVSEVVVRPLLHDAARIGSAADFVHTMVKVKFPFMVSVPVQGALVEHELPFMRIW